MKISEESCPGGRMIFKIDGTAWAKVQTFENLRPEQNQKYFGVDKT